MFFIWYYSLDIIACAIRTIGKPIKNECFNLWDLNAIIREKQAKLYKENIEFREKQIEKITKQK